MSSDYPEEADVCIIGCGATGSVAAYVLAQAGIDVVALDAGPVWEQRDFEPDELRGEAFENYLGPKWNSEPVLWNDEAEGLARTGAGLAMMNGVGGSAIHYAGHAWRFHPSDFRLRSGTVERYGTQALPAGHSVEDWPIGYEDLEHYYDIVEHEIGVSGRAGVLYGPDGREHVIQPGGNPFDGPRRRDYPMPPLRMHKLGKMVWDAAERLGYHPFMGPTAVNSVPYDGRPSTNYCGFCLGYGCRIKAKGSPNVNILPKALWTGNLEVIDEANVVWLDAEPPRSGNGLPRLRSVRFVKDGKEHEIRAKAFMLAGYTFENVRLMLNSRGALFPNGLGNSNGQVGKHFMVHRFDSVAVWFENEYVNRFGNHGQRVVIDDFNADNFDHSGLGFIAGAQIFVPNELHPLQDLSVVPPGTRAWGREYKAYVKENWNRLGYIMSILEVLPYESNFLELDTNRLDAYGVPMMRANFSIHENERRLLEFTFQKMELLAKEAGAHVSMRLPSPAVPSQHDAGGTRMGEDPRSSVVDPWSRSHEVDNLFVLGPSTFPTSGGHNPSLTAQALAWRTAEHALQQLG